jgi:hypothetical protein
MNNLKKLSTVYSELEDYISAYTAMENIKIIYYQTMLIYFFAFELILLLIFIIYACYSKFLGKLKIL